MHPLPRIKPSALLESRALRALACALGVLLAQWLLCRPAAPVPALQRASSGTPPAPVIPAAQEEDTEAAGAPSQAESNRTIHTLWSDGRGVVWVVGGPGRAWRSSDDGRTFARVLMPVQEPLVGVTGSPGGAVLVATSRALYRSRDNGGSWTPVARLGGSGRDAAPRLTSLYSDGTALWVSGDGDEEGTQAVYTMALGGRGLTRLPERYDEIRAIIGRRGAVLVLNVVYNCHSGDYLAVDRMRDGGRAFRRVERGADDFAHSADDTRAAYMTPGGDLYLLAGWAGDPSGQVLLRRRAGEGTFQRAPLIAEAIWANDEGAVFITTPQDGVRRSTDSGRSFGAPSVLP